MKDIVQFYETEQFSLHSRWLFVTIKIRLHSYMSVLKLDASYIYIILHMLIIKLIFLIMQKQVSIILRVYRNNIKPTTST